MTPLTAKQQAELRAKKALESGDVSFKPRGQVNKALFEKMKEELDKKANEINMHTSSVGDRIIKELTPLGTLFNGSESTNPQDRINARILQNSANTKANKEDWLLIREQKAKAEAKGKAEHIPVARTASTAPSEQMESDRDESMENKIDDDDIIEVPRREDDKSSDEAMPRPAHSNKDADEESSDDCGERTCKHPRITLTSYVPKKIVIAHVAWAETCDDTDKENLFKPIRDVAALLKGCGYFHDVKRVFNDRLPGELNWPRGYELNYKESELAVYIHRESPYAFRLGELLCKVSRSV